MHLGVAHRLWHSALKDHLETFCLYSHLEMHRQTLAICRLAGLSGSPWWKLRSFGVPSPQSRARDLAARSEGPLEATEMHPGRGGAAGGFPVLRGPERSRTQQNLGAAAGARAAGGSGEGPRIPGRGLNDCHRESFLLGNLGLSTPLL